MIYNKIQENFESIILPEAGLGKVYFGSELVWEKVSGNFLLYDIEGEELFLTDYPLTYPKELFYPVGIVVVPQSHNRYKNGELAVISLRYPSLTNPSEGQATYFGSGIGMGGNAKKYYNRAACLGYFSDSSVSPVITLNLDLGSYGNGSVPYNNARYVDSYRWRECPTDPGVYWRRPGSISGYGYAPSPYLINGGVNFEYGRTTSPATTANCMSDFDGKENTANFVEKCTALETWRTDETLPYISPSSTWSAIFVTAWRYSPMGTKEGDWYIPSAGELGYVAARFDKIDEWIVALQEHFEIELGKLPVGDPFWSSTFYNTSLAIKLDTEGRFERQDLTMPHAGRPFMRGLWKGRKQYVPKIN